jgi:hypothetical protein
MRMEHLPESGDYSALHIVAAFGTFDPKQLLIVLLAVVDIVLEEVTS